MRTQSTVDSAQAGLTLAANAKVYRSSAQPLERAPVCLHAHLWINDKAVYMKISLALEHPPALRWV